MIAPRLPASVTEVQVNLFALKPHYFKRRIGTQDFVEHASNFYRRPTNTARRMTVTCRRMGQHRRFYARPTCGWSPRPASALQRQGQCLLVSDYWDEPGAAQHKRVHRNPASDDRSRDSTAHAVRRTNQRERCGVYKVIGINQGQSLHVAVHALTDGTTTREELRESVFRWMRRIYAPAHARPVIENLEIRPVPRNILSIANQAAATAGSTHQAATAPGGPRR